MPSRIAVIAAIALAIPAVAHAQQATPAAPPSSAPLSSFTSMKVQVVPVQTWHPDSAGWSRDITWATARAVFDSTLQAVLEERGLGKKWAYASDAVRIAKRNPTYASDPYSLGVGRLRTMEMKDLKVGETIPPMLGDNLRPFTAIGDTRYALIPVEVRAQGDAVVLRLILADTRSRGIMWGAELRSTGGAQFAASLATKVADLIIEP